MAEPPSKLPLKKPPGFKEPENVGQPVVRLEPQPLKPVYSPLYQPQKKQRRRGCCCCCCCCVFWIIIFVLIFAVAVAVALIFLMYNPQPPVFRLQYFRVPNFNVTQKPDGAYLDADTVVRVEVKNPNGKMQYYFGSTRLDVWAEDGNLELGSTMLPGFAMKEMEVTNLKAETSVKGEPLDEWQGNNLMNRFESKELVPNVGVRTAVGVNLQGWKIGSLGIDVVCGNVSMKKLQGGDVPKCTIILLKWIKIH